MQSQSNSLLSFTLFPDLPAELRAKIWIHTIDWRSHVLPRPPITELSVCHEAREILLKIYRPCFRPFPKYRKDDTFFGVSSNHCKRWLHIHGMGNRSPRTPYANYESDFLWFDYYILGGLQQGELLQKFLFQEAIENIRHVIFPLHAWAPRRHGFRVREAPKPESKLALTHFGALKTLSFADEPRMEVSIAPLDEDQIREERELRGMGIKGTLLDDEFLKSDKATLRSNFAEGKILVPVHEPTEFKNSYFSFGQAKQWVDLKRTELPSWSVPEVQYATIIPDPQG